MTFFDLLNEGKVSPEEIEDFIEQWHCEDNAEPLLWRFLGLSEQQYSAWLLDADYLEKYRVRMSK